MKIKLIGGKCDGDEIDLSTPLDRIEAPFREDGKLFFCTYQIISVEINRMLFCAYVPAPDEDIPTQSLQDRGFVSIYSKEYRELFGS